MRRKTRHYLLPTAIGVLGLFCILAAGAAVAPVAGVSLFGGSCGHASGRRRRRCLEEEEAILDATVRLVLHGYVEVDDRYGMQRIKGGSSHATVFDGRYLLTHNHFGLPLSQVGAYARYANHFYGGVSVIRLDGTVVLDHAPLDSFKVVSERGETALLDFGTVAGEGLLAHAGLDSAVPADPATLPLAAGEEVAVIDVNAAGETRVVWTTVQRLGEMAGRPVMRIDHVVRKGSSGGGAFYHGRHVGNVWGSIVATNRDTGAQWRDSSVVALNGS